MGRLMNVRRRSHRCDLLHGFVEYGWRNGPELDWGEARNDLGTLTNGPRAIGRVSEEDVNKTSRNHHRQLPGNHIPRGRKGLVLRRLLLVEAPCRKCGQARKGGGRAIGDKVVCRWRRGGSQRRSGMLWGSLVTITIERGADIVGGTSYPTTREKPRVGCEKFNEKVEEATITRKGATGARCWGGEKNFSKTASLGKKNCQPLSLGGERLASTSVKMGRGPQSGSVAEAMQSKGGKKMTGTDEFQSSMF